MKYLRLDTYPIRPVTNFLPGSLIINEEGDCFKILPNQELKLLVVSPLWAEHTVLGLSAMEFNLYKILLNSELKLMNINISHLISKPFDIYLKRIYAK